MSAAHRWCVRFSSCEAIQLVVIMYETGRPGPSAAVRTAPELRNACETPARSLRFELSWIGTPTVLRNGKATIHHLNGSCLVLDRDGQMLTVVDFQRQVYEGIRHGGPSSKFSPKQSLAVETAMVPERCHYLFFTLSGFMPGGVSLAIFQNPSVQLRNGMTNEVLASYTADRCRSEEAGCIPVT